MKKVTDNWFTLDNAGRIFPGQNTSYWSNTFRVSIELKEEIVPEILKEALDRTLARLPGFNVRIRRGAFWYYFEKNTNSCPVRQDVKNFCYRIDYKEDNGFLFRVFYYGKKISMDIYHALCDGYGGAVFLSTMAAEYLRLRGYDISCNSLVLDVNEEPSQEETEDSYKRYASSTEKYGYPDDWVYHRRGTKLPVHMTNFTAGTMSFSQLRCVSKEYGVTITEFLSAVLLSIHYRKMLSECKSKKKVSVQIPVNLRKAFPSSTLRNFVLCLRAQLEPREEEYTFEDILSCVSTQLRSVNNADFLNAMFTKNVKMDKQVARFIPLPLKDFFIGAGFQLTAEKSTSTLISNLGNVALPEDMKPYVERFFLYTGPGIVNGARCGVATVGDKLCFTFSNCYKEGDIEREFFSALVGFGIDVTVETNRTAEAKRWSEFFTVGDKDAYSKRFYIPEQAEKTVFEKNKNISKRERLSRFFNL